MVHFEKSVAAAVAIADYDFLANEDFQEKPYPRVITHIGLVGSAAELDTAVTIEVGGTKVGQLYNSQYSGGNVGTPLYQGGNAMKPCFILVPSSTIVTAIVTDASDTNDVVLGIDATRVPAGSRLGS